MKIGDRVTYNDESPATTDVLGTVVEPTEQDLEIARNVYGDTVLGPERGDVVVAWDDGDRYWEDPSYLTVIEACS